MQEAAVAVKFPAPCLSLWGLGEQQFALGWWKPTHGGLVCTVAALGEV